jgi:hypothetical protein
MPILSFLLTVLRIQFWHLIQIFIFYRCLANEHTSGKYTKKENKFFLNKEIQKGPGAKSYLTNGLLNPHTYMSKDLRISIRKPFLICDFAPDPWNFFICEENFKGLVAVCHSFCIYLSLYNRYIHTSFIRKHSLRPISISSQLSAQWVEPPWGAEPRIELRPACLQASALPTMIVISVYVRNVALLPFRSTVNGRACRKRCTGGVELAPAASSGHRRHRAGIGGVWRAPPVSSWHWRCRAGTGGVERKPTLSSRHQ